jgi:glycosyltransferase involved in cell wall biosynthesis
LSPPLDASVILATYKQLPSTTLALHALFAQETQSKYEVIVCDDGSDAATIGGLLPVLEHAPVPAYLAWQQDQGFRAAASRNNGIKMARGRIVIMLDGDMVPARDFVENHVQAHVRERVVAIGQRRWRDPELMSAAGTDGGDMQALWALLRDDSAERLTKATENFELLYRHVLWKAAPWMACFSCNVSVPRSHLVEFDEEFVGWGYEDYELFYRLNVIHGFTVLPIDADAYELGGRVDRSTAWTQRHFVDHLVNGFRFHDKWAHTGLTYPQSIPRYDLDPDAGNWRFSGLPVFGPRATDFPAYIEMARGWLVTNGYYPDMVLSRESAS